MESEGSFGDLLAAFNIDSEDTDVANATHQYDEVADDGKPVESQINTQGNVKQPHDQQTTDTNDDKSNTDEVSKPSLATNDPAKVHVDNNPSQGLIPITLNSEIGPVSVGGLVSVPVPQITTLVPPVPEITAIPTVPQLPGGAVLLPNLPQNLISNQTLVTQPQLQPFIQSYQDVSNLLANQMLLNSSGVMGATPILPQGIVPDLTQTLINQSILNSSPSVVNLGGGIQNNVIAVPMSLFPTVLNQPTVVTPSAGIAPSGIVTPTGIITPMVTPSPSPSPSPIAILPSTSDISMRRVGRKGRAFGSTPTVQELLDERRRIQTPSPVNSNVTTPSIYSILEEMPLTLSGRKRRHTKRYIEYLANKDESEDDLAVPKTKRASPPKLKSPVLDLNKPLTDQLITMSETATVQTGLKITNVQSLSVPSLPQTTDNRTGDNVSTSKSPNESKEYSSIQIKQEPMESDDGGLSVSRSSVTSESTDKSHDQSHDENGSDSGSSKKQDVVAPDGTIIKREPVENDPPLQSRKRKQSISETVRKSKRLQQILPKEAEKEPDSVDAAEALDKPLDFRKPIRTREEEERIASEAAARAASQALLRVASQAIPDAKKEKAAVRKEDELRMTRLAEQYQKQQAAEQEIREAAQRVASKAAARAASLAIARAAAEELEPEIPDPESLREAEEAARIASEAATRAVAEAAKRAFAEAAERATKKEETHEDLRIAEKEVEEEARRIASEAATRAATEAATRAASEAATRAAAQAAARAAKQAAETPVDLSTSKSPLVAKQEVTEASQEDLNQIAQQAAARAVLAAQSRTSNNYVPILPATSYSKPTHIKQIIKDTDSDLVDLFENAQEQTVNVALVKKAQEQIVNIAVVEPIVQEDREVHKVVTTSKQIITYPKNPSKNLRESLAWKSFQEGVKQGKYKTIQKSAAPLVLEANGRQRAVGAHTLTVIKDMRCPYCLIQMKIKANLIQHATVCLRNPRTHDEEYFTSHIASISLKSPSRLCCHCTPNASSVKELKSWSNVLCRLCVTKCADPKITERSEANFVATLSGYFVCKHCGIGLDSEADMNNHLSQDQVKKDLEKRIKKTNREEKKSLPVSKILSKKENDSTFQFRCGQCRLMFASVGRLLVHTSHCNLNQYIKVLERLSLYSCVNCPVACKVVPDDGKPHMCKPSSQYSGTFKKNLQAVRDIGVGKESFVCLRCEEIFPSNGHLVLHTKQCNHAQYHLLMRYLDQPPYCSRCLMVFTSYKAYSQHRQMCMKVPRQGLQDCSPLSFCEKCCKSVQREEADLMYHDAVCVGLPCTQQKLLFPDGFNSQECCMVVNSW